MNRLPFISFKRSLGSGSANEETPLDDLLELVWMLNESGRPTAADLIATTDQPEEQASALLERLCEKGLVRLRNEEIALTPEGDRKAGNLIRRHRLAECLLSEVFDLDIHREEQQSLSDACRFDHILTPEITESICTFLGHPPVCPHGRAIPRGDCCHKFRKNLKPLVTPLTELQPGDNARIVFMTPKSHLQLDRLSTLGIFPGSPIHLHQKRPAYVVQVGETDIALDHEIAREIYVKKIGV
ncbi:MAG: metal-dependent transcriptional regulator [Armatimonadetes bacterium]|nr:metal-dependent transcriptional regulator [Armatimonadota bacterium]